MSTTYSFESELKTLPPVLALMTDEEEQFWNITSKVLSIVVILSMTVLFGFFPFFCNGCRKSVKILGIANAFSGGIFLGIALFHLLPESVENIEDFFKDKDDSVWKRMPMSFFLAFIAYALILFVEKIAFDSHALIEHDHGDGEGHHDHEAKELESKRQSKTKDEEEESDSDVEEETMKNVISSKGKFASFLHMRNSMLEKQQTKSFVDNNQNRPLLTHKKDRALMNASLLLTKTLTKSFREPENEDLQYLVNPSNVHVDERDAIHNIQAPPKEFKPKSNLTPFLLLIALSLHGFFEGIALGIQSEFQGTIFLFIAIVSHKWAEALTLVKL